jgi:hypothetical protein
MLISEPQLKWPIVLIAAFITIAIALLAVGMHMLTMTRPYLDPSYAEQRLERALRPGDLEFEQAREQIVIEHLVGKEKSSRF